MAKTFLVAGHGRSGTSMTARILHENGISMGKNLKGPSEWNWYGYYEDYDLMYTTSKRILGHGNARFKNDALCNELEEAIEKNKEEYWGFKMVAWMTTMWEVLEPFLENPHFIVTHRNEKAQAKSVRRSVKRKDVNTLRQKVRETYSIIDEITEGYPRLDIDFERWFKEPQQQMQELCEFTGIEYSDELVDKYIDKRLWHFK